MSTPSIFLIFTLFFKLKFLISLSKLPNCKLKKSQFEVQDIGNIESEFWYYVNNGDLIFISENMFELKNRKEFSRKFQVSSKLLKNVNKIYFNLEKNIDNGEISISQVYINKIDKENFSEKIFIIKNIQLFKAFIREILT